MNQMMKLPVLILLLLPNLSFGQPTVDLHQAFTDLTHDGVLMNISAHPDDEDGATLAYYRKKLGVKTYSVFLTRGEGGQNEKGPELYEELGVLRTAETEAAAAILGSEVRFLNFFDFGYSKTATETFAKWGGKKEVVGRLVYLIRKLRPDVLFTNFNTIEGHGHHQAAAIASIEAFDAAADSAYYPEQLKEPGITLWQPRKLFFRSRGRFETVVDVANAVGDVDSVLGMDYIGIATRALRMHKTQGMDRADLGSSGRRKTLYRLIRANSEYERDSTTFFGGIDFGLDPSVRQLAPIIKSIGLLREGIPRDSLVPLCSEVLAMISDVRGKSGLTSLSTRMLGLWEEKIERLVGLVCGLGASFTLHDSVLVPQQKVDAELNVMSGDCTLSGVKYSFEIPSGWAVGEKPGSAPEFKSRMYRQDFTLIVGDRPQPTIPRTSCQYGSMFHSQNIRVHLTFLLNGLRMSHTLSPRFDIAPRQLLTITPRVARIATDRVAKGKVFEFTVRNYMPHMSAGTLRVEAAAGWRAEYQQFTIQHEDSIARGKITVWPPAGIAEGDYPIRFKSDLTSESVMVRVFNVTVSGGTRVGVIESYDNTIISALKELDVACTQLDSTALKSGTLSLFTTIIVDMRAYLVRDDLRQYNTRLLEYVKNGGNLVVMYQRDQEWRPAYAPYPFDVSRKRVSVEEAPIVMLQPDHPLLRCPNVISDEAWDGWKQERGVYFPSNVPSNYAQLLSTHDPDEPPLSTGHLVASWGKGSYIYTSYVWYRQLKEMHPGAFRCFANMISYPACRK
jgi:LmbE family N-acetylglucosaminyl deacetylase